MPTGESLASRERPVLVIGYGSQLRSDDAVGPRVAQAIEGMELRGVTVLCRHQLTPEVAQIVSTSRLVIFVDASSLEGEVRIESVSPAASGQFPAHRCDPPALLALAECVFGHSPPAWCVSIPCENFEIGEELSALARRGVAVATREVVRLVSQAQLGEDSVDRQEKTQEQE